MTIALEDGDCGPHMRGSKDKGWYQQVKGIEVSDSVVPQMVTRQDSANYSIGCLAQQLDALLLFLMTYTWEHSSLRS